MAKSLMKFQRVYVKSQFGLTADVVCQPNIYTAFGTVTVPAGQQITFGVGGLGQTDSREICYIDLQSNDGTPVDLDGTVRLVLADPNEINTVVVAEQRTERLRASSSDKTQGYLLGEYPIKAKQDSKLILQFKPDGASALTIGFDTGETDMLVPVTVYQ